MNGEGDVRKELRKEAFDGWLVPRASKAPLPFSLRSPGLKPGATAEAPGLPLKPGATTTNLAQQSLRGARAY
jgi:hypothetical protein